MPAMVPYARRCISMQLHDRLNIFAYLCTVKKAEAMKILRWGFIGCGEVTEKKSGPAFSMVEGSSVVAVMSRTAEKARSYAERHGVPRWYTGAD